MPEYFDTALNKIRQEIKSRLVHHGLFGTVTSSETPHGDSATAATRIEIAVKGRSAGRTFPNDQIEACVLRVGGPVLAGIIVMIDELSA